MVNISGAEIVREYDEGAYTGRVTYRQRCATCGYTPPTPPITVTYCPGDTVLHGCYHKESFLCSFCGNRQEVAIQG